MRSRPPGDHPQKSPGKAGELEGPPGQCQVGLWNAVGLAFCHRKARGSSKALPRASLSMWQGQGASPRLLAPAGHQPLLPILLAV